MSVTKYYVVAVYKSVYAGYGDEEIVMVDMVYQQEGHSNRIHRERFFHIDKWEKVERVGYFLINESNQVV